MPKDFILFSLKYKYRVASTSRGRYISLFIEDIYFSPWTTQIPRVLTRLRSNRLGYVHKLGNRNLDLWKQSV